ncbi:MAG: hypothetical protein M3552_16615 [Planctomycetota bacterium]|nr:hypothetical protein [Planctomycetaceae bacterium]MDQ3332246.1 hypothetical protein [Planctomycetota bacterium]
MRRAKWGIGAVVVVGLAWVLSNLFNMNIGGIGTEDGGRVGLPTQTSISPSANEEIDTATPPAQSEPITEGETVALEGPDKAIGVGGVVEVLVEDRSFSIRRGSGEDAVWIAAEPDVIASYARQAEGDETGVRVRVFRRPSALASAEEELAEKLRSAGLTNAEIDVRQQLLNEN